MTHKSEDKSRLRFWISLTVLCLIGSIPLLWLTGVLRPPRPLFHSMYATPFNSERLPHWVPDAPVEDDAGNMCYFDLPMNLVLLDLASERPESFRITRDLALPAPQGEQWLDVSLARVSVPVNPRDLLIVTGNNKVVSLSKLQPGDAAVMKAWWGGVNDTRPDAVRALIDDDRVPQSIRTAMEDLSK